MLSNTWDANRRFATSSLRFCRLLGYKRHILVIRMIRELYLVSLKVGRYEVAKRRRASRDIQGITKKL